MGKIKTFSDGSFVEYGEGSFDYWCVYLTRPEEIRTPPKDIHLFYQLEELSNNYSANKVYEDFVSIYALTEKEEDKKVLALISRIASTYDLSDSLEADILLSSLYLMMIAEMNKKNTKLGKRIKRLGVHKLLIEGVSANDAANSMRGLKSGEISRMCDERGF